MIGSYRVHHFGSSTRRKMWLKHNLFAVSQLPEQQSNLFHPSLKFSTLCIINLATSVGWHTGTFCQPEKCQLLLCRYMKHDVFSFYYCACSHNPQGPAKRSIFPAAFMHGNMWLEEIVKLSQYLSSKIPWCF